HLTEVKEETNIPMNVWLDELAQLNEDIMFLSPHIHVFQEMIEEKMNKHFYIPVEQFHIPSPSNMFTLIDMEVNVHTITPNYLRITEAEANLLKQQKGIANES